MIPLPISLSEGPCAQLRSKKFGTKSPNGEVVLCTFSTTKCLPHSRNPKPSSCREDRNLLMMRCSAHALHRLISSKDAAASLGVSQATVLRAVARGLVRHIPGDPGGHRRFSAEGVEAFAERWILQPGASEVA